MKVVVPFLVVGFIAGCGGSSDSGDSGSGTTVDSNLELISGVYDTTRDSTSDESYLYISDTGAVTAYDYEGDSVGSGSNCYSIPADYSQTNYSLTGGTVTYSSTEEVYTLTNGDVVLTFEYDTTEGMNDFVYNSIFSSSTGLDIKGSNVNLYIGTPGQLQSTTVTISDITSALCD